MHSVLYVSSGYGNIFPSSAFGKLLTIPYGVIGIPLTLYYMAEVGKLLTLVFKLLLRKRWPTFDNTEDFNFSPFLAVSVTTGYLLLGVALFDFWEDDWDLVDAGYFSFVTFSTVGFGDLLPSDQGYMLLLMVYSLSALSLCAMCFTVIQGSLEKFLDSKQEQLCDWWAQRKQKAADAAAKKDDDSAANYIPPSSGGGASFSLFDHTATLEEDEEIEADEVEEEED